MNTHNIEPEEEEVSNPEQFQVGRSKSTDNSTEQDDDSVYTPEEKEFADGEGTQLAEAFDEEDTENEDDN